MLLAAVLPLPYWYYQLLRWVTCAVAVFIAVKAYSWRKIWAVWLFGVIAVLFNPIVPIHLTKEIWQPIDLASALAFGLSILFLSGPFKIGSCKQSSLPGFKVPQRKGLQSQNWFQRHPNGTAVIAMLLGFTFAGFGSFDAADRMATGLGALIYYFVAVVEGVDTRELMFVLIGLGLCLPVLGWIFKQKTGSIWGGGWILLAFIPFWWIMFPFIGNPGDTDFGPNFWRGFRQTICSAGIIAMVVLMVFAWTYDLPVKARVWDGPYLVDIKDYSNAPLWVRMGSQTFFPFVVGGFLLYGALRK